MNPIAEGVFATQFVIAGDCCVLGVIILAIDFFRHARRGRDRSCMTKYLLA